MHRLVFWEQTSEADFEVTARRRRRVTLDPELWPKIEAQARTRVFCLKH